MKWFARKASSGISPKKKADRKLTGLIWRGWDIPTTRALIERLEVAPRLRALCGWIYTREIPSESTFSRAFAESDLAGRMHEALIKETLGQGIVGHVQPHMAP